MSRSFGLLLALASCLQIIFAQKCQLEEVKFGDCMKNLNAKVTVSTKNKVVKSDSRNSYREDVIKCFQENKCITDQDKFVPSDNEKTDICVAQARNFYKQNVINCVQKDPKGDPKYNITESEQLKDADGNKRFNAQRKYGYDKCREKKIPIGPVKKCIDGKSPKPDAATPAPAAFVSLDSLLNLGNVNSLIKPFQDMCGAKSSCLTSISPNCNQAICGCHFSESVKKNITDTIKSCLSDAGLKKTDKQMSGLVDNVKQGFQLEFCSKNVKNPCDNGNILESISGKKQSSSLDLSSLFPNQKKTG